MSLDVVQAYKRNPGAETSLVPEVLALLINKANIDPAKEMASIEKWYNDTMECVSGWYKRKVQLIIFVLGFVIAVGLNIDTISIVNGLLHNSVLQAALVSAAQGTASSPSIPGIEVLQRSFGEIQPLIVWSTSTLPTDFGGWVLKIVGLLITTFAVSLGAPFWFDLLNKFTGLRLSGPRPQTSTGVAGSNGMTIQVVAGDSTTANAHTQSAISTNGSAPQGLSSSDQ